MNHKERADILSEFNYIFKNEINYYGKQQISLGGIFKLETENFFRNAYLKFKDLLGNIKGKTILDVGCGKGSLSFYLTKMGANVTGIDLSQNYIDFCQKEVKRRSLTVDFKVMNAQIPDFEDESFDIIVGFRIIHHLPDIELFFKECKRILRKKGYIVFIEPLKKNPIVEFNRKYIAPKMRTTYEHPLLMSEIKKGEKIFGNIEHYEFFLISPFARVLQRFIKKNSVFKTTYKFLNFIEKPLYKIIFFKNFCWQIVFKCVNIKV